MAGRGSGVLFWGKIGVSRGKFGEISRNNLLNTCVSMIDL